MSDATRRQPDIPAGRSDANAPAGSDARSRRGLPAVTSRAAALAMAGLVGVMAVGVLVGWASGRPLLASWLPGLVETKVNAALAFIGLATALAFMARTGESRQPAVLIASLAVVAIAGATLVEYITGLNLGIDQVFVEDKASAASPYPGRFAVMTAVAFIMSAAGMIAYRQRVRGLYPTEIFAVACAVVGGVSLLGYLYGADALLSLGSVNQISLPASIALLAIGIGQIASNPEHALVRQIANPEPAGQVARRVLPAALVVVPLGAWLRLIGERAGLYDESIGLSILVTIEALVLAAIGVWTTASVNSLERRRRQAELDLIRLGAAVSTPLIETAPIGLAVLDQDLRYLYVNPALASMDGVDSLAHLGQRLDRISPQLGPDLTPALEGVIATGIGVREMEIDGQPLSGSPSLAWLLSAEPLRDESGETLGLALSMVDITERKRREEALAALSELQKQAQVIGDSIPFGFWIADEGGRMRYMSQSFLDLIGRSAEEARGLGWLDALAPEKAEETRTGLKDAVEGRSPWSLEFAVRDSGGRLRTVVSRGLPIRDEAGRVTSWAGINFDLTDRKDTEEFREAFAGILSHELRTPITSIHAASTLLGRPGLDEEQRSELLNDINEESERLRRLVEDMVVLAKAERGPIQIHTEPVLLPHILRRVCASEQLRWPGHQIECTVLGDPAIARAETASVEQIARNLIANAAKYGPPDGRIDIVIDMLDGCPRVRILDRGPGVDPDEANRLFELFYRSPRNANVSGSGIGLFLAERLIESMNGTIWARPRSDGEGSEFGFTLPPMTEDA